MLEFFGFDLIKIIRIRLYFVRTWSKGLVIILGVILSKIFRPVDSVDLEKKLNFDPLN